MLDPSTSEDTETNGVHGIHTYELYVALKCVSLASLLPSKARARLRGEAIRIRSVV
jgi:hypothetical protein